MNLRRAAHLLADDIYQAHHRRRGLFRHAHRLRVGKRPEIERASSASPSWIRTARITRILTDGGVLVLTPRFSPAAQDITYMSYYGNKPRVYLFNIDSGQQEVLGDFPGMTFAPRFSPDGSEGHHEHGAGRQHRYLCRWISGRAAPSASPTRRASIRRRATRRTASRSPSKATAAAPSRSTSWAPMGRARAESARGRGAMAPRSGRPRGDLIAVHPHVSGQLLRRCDASRRFGRADAVPGLAGGRPDLGPERAGFGLFQAGSAAARPSSIASTSPGTTSVS